MTGYLARPPSSGSQSPLMATFRPPVERRTDWVNPVVLVVLAVVGVCFIKSAQVYSGGAQWLSQIVWLLLGAGLYVVMGRVDYHVWSRHALWVYFLSVALLILVLTPLGQVRSGASRWIGVGGLTIQPSEFAKVGTLIMLASILARSELGTVRESLEMLGKVGLAVALPIVLIFRQPDLGSSLAFFPMVFALLYVSNLSARFFVTVFLIFLLGLGLVYGDMQNYLHYLQGHDLQANGVVVENDAPDSQKVEVAGNDSPAYQKYLAAWNERNYQRYLSIYPLPAGAAEDLNSPDYIQYLQASHLEPRHLTAQEAQKYDKTYEKTSLLPLKTYQLNRILSFLEPEVADPQGVGATWNLKQSLIAVGSGGLTGKGYENGTQARLGYLPRNVAISDFIMSVFLEETGFIGGVAVLGLFAILLGNTLRIAGLARDRFGQLLCVGAAVVFMVHVFVNIGMVQGLMPVKGIPLPFMSSGGSFVLTCCLLMGLVQSVYRHRREAV